MEIKKIHLVQKLAFAGIAFLLALIAVIKPFLKSSDVNDIGWLLVWAAILVFIQGFKRPTLREKNSAHNSAVITLLLGLLLINYGHFQSKAVIVFAALLFIWDAFRNLFVYIRLKKSKQPYITHLLSTIGNTGVLLAMLFFKGKSFEWIMALMAGLRIAGMGFEILTSRIGEMEDVGEDVVESMEMQDSPEIVAIAEDIENQEEARAPIDRYWIITFLVVLFFIHLGRMGFDRSSTGLLSPIVALIGDIVIALIIAYVIIIPGLSLLRKLSRPFEKKLWLWVAEKPKSKSFFNLRGLVRKILEGRMRKYIRIRKAGYSLKTALRSGLQTGLPYAAILAAIIPVFGMSWYFDTENWASGIWDGWAAKRTDVWRSAMVKAVVENPDASSFLIKPDGVSDSASFSFLIIGDPGEGDASQYILHDQIVTKAEKEAVKFVVISSDIVYPDGAMKDYETNFWLPMKGVHKPVYAIPGNHDWYDALEGFASTFFDSASARKAMKSRRAADLNLTKVTNRKIEAQIKEAARLRNEFDVPTGFQQAPYFHLQTKDFAFICVETGVKRRIDDVQMKWLKEVLEISKGKFILVLLGHPFYAAGEYQGNMNADFAALHQLLRDYNVNIAMAGDTHDLEYYLEPLKGKDTGKIMHHFVNGGGGAYLSLGAALKPRDQLPEKVWAHYPATTPIIEKIETNTNIIKKPAWYWTKKFNGWPFSAEWLSAAFDYNKAPYFQSFIEVQIDRIQNKIRLLAHGTRGQLKWREIDYSPGLKPAEVAENAGVEWVFPLK